jgi:serine/threonine protein kinase
MPSDDVLRVGKEIHVALAFMHKKGYGHNDIKPSNVLLSTDGRCRLCDFGSAAALGAPVLSSTPVFRASDAGLVTAAQLDFKMLAATLLYKLGLHAAETAPNVPQMSSLALKVVHDDLRAFLFTLLA